MHTTTPNIIYTDLFEDEIADVLRSLRNGDSITTDNAEYYPAHMMDEDGVYTSGNSAFTVYIRGRRCGYVNARYLINALAHTTFEIKKN